jgi:hypothetical protein
VTQFLRYSTPNRDSQQNYSFIPSKTQQCCIIIGILLRQRVSVGVSGGTVVEALRYKWQPRKLYIFNNPRIIALYIWEMHFYLLFPIHLLSEQKLKKLCRVTCSFLLSFFLSVFQHLPTIYVRSSKCYL